MSIAEHTTNAGPGGLVPLKVHRRRPWSPSCGTLNCVHPLALKMPRRTDDVPGGSWKPSLTGNILGTTFRALLQPYREEDGKYSNSPGCLKKPDLLVPLFKFEQMCLFLCRWLLWQWPGSASCSIALWQEQSGALRSWYLLRCGWVRVCMAASPYLGSNMSLHAADSSLKISFYVFP